ncbi:hypothetical protein SEVIR_1G221501v4 [Setaria viridis]
MAGWPHVCLSIICLAHGFIRVVGHCLSCVVCVRVPVDSGVVFRRAPVCAIAVLSRPAGERGARTCVAVVPWAGQVVVLRLSRFGASSSCREVWMMDGKMGCMQLQACSGQLYL